MAVAEEMGVEHNVVLYIKTPPDRKALEEIIAGLEDPVEDLVRKDSKFKKLQFVLRNKTWHPYISQSFAIGTARNLPSASGKLKDGNAANCRIRTRLIVALVGGGMLDG